VSGIAVANSGNGTFQVYLNPNDTSGLSDGSYAYVLSRTDSGYASVLTEGFLILNR
jgi:hypothetical protein